jgi:hypothetical protein
VPKLPHTHDSFLAPWQVRQLGNNRILAGIVLLQTRHGVSTATHRFSDMFKEVHDGKKISAEPYGINPYFLPQSDLFNPTLNVTLLYPEVRSTSILAC